MPAYNPFEKSWIPWYSQSNNTAGLEKDTRAVTKVYAYMLVVVLFVTVIVIFTYFDKVSDVAKVISFIGLFTVACGIRMIAYRSKTRKIIEQKAAAAAAAAETAAKQQAFNGTQTNQVTPDRASSELQNQYKREQP
jgi:predicted signal transduction protein with EAL and GGDEF domain